MGFRRVQLYSTQKTVAGLPQIFGSCITRFYKTHRPAKTPTQTQRDCSPDSWKKIACNISKEYLIKKSTEPEFVNLLRRPVIDSQPSRPIQQPYLMYRPARVRICKCLRSPGIDSKDSIMGA
jgi:hypothetical protein